MIPKNHVTNLELSKKLEELGEPQVSEFYWIKPSSAQKAFVVDKENLGKRDIDTLEYVYSAFLASELGRELPVDIQCRKTPRGWEVIFWGKGPLMRSMKNSRAMEADTLPNALAKMLIYLKENNLLKI